MSLFSTPKPSAPSFGYLLEKWEQVGYRATAHAYMKRNGLNFVAHQNGHTYSLSEVESNMINTTP